MAVPVPGSFKGVHTRVTIRDLQGYYNIGALIHDYLYYFGGFLIIVIA